jgi:hypothetical protein
MLQIFSSSFYLPGIKQNNITGKQNELEKNSATLQRIFFFFDKLQG